MTAVRVALRLNAFDPLSRPPQDRSPNPFFCSLSFRGGPPSHPFASPSSNAHPLQEGCQQLLVDTEGDNFPAINLFNKLNFSHKEKHVYFSKQLHSAGSAGTGAAGSTVNRPGFRMELNDRQGTGGEGSDDVDLDDEEDEDGRGILVAPSTAPLDEMVIADDSAADCASSRAGHR